MSARLFLPKLRISVHYCNVSILPTENSSSSSSFYCPCFPWNRGWTVLLKFLSLIRVGVLACLHISLSSNWAIVGLSFKVFLYAVSPYKRTRVLSADKFCTLFPDTNFQIWPTLLLIGWKSIFENKNSHYIV